MNVAVPSAPMLSAAWCDAAPPAQPAEVQRRFEEVPDGRQASWTPSVTVALDAGEDLVRGGQTAGRLQHEHEVGRRTEDVQLAVGPDVVDTGVRAGVGEEQQSGVEAEGGQ